MTWNGSAEQQRQVYERFAPDSTMRIYGRGVRRRLAPMLGGDRRCLELAQWADEANAGFSAASAERLLRPVIVDGPFSYHQINVAAQRQDQGSLLSWLRALIWLRKGCPELGLYGCQVVEHDTASLLAQRYGDPGHTLLTVHNLSSQQQ